MNSYDNAPISHTCPMIDSIIDRMRYAVDQAEWSLENPDEEHTAELDSIISSITSAISDMEEIRDANATLRDWGNGLFYEKEELEKEVDELREQIWKIVEKINSEQDSGSEIS